MTFRLIRADARQLLDHVDPGTVQCCVTSPPYWGLRRYGDDQAELGTEDLHTYLDHLVQVLALVRTALRPNGLLWVNIGDTATASGGAGGDWTPDPERTDSARSKFSQRKWRQSSPTYRTVRPGALMATIEKLAPKQWSLVPYRLAAALQDDGWRVRSVVTWAKTYPNGRQMWRPESLRYAGRPGVASELILMLAPTKERPRFYASQLVEKGDVWHFPPSKGNGHAAPFPDELARRCILPSTLPGDLVLDPFAGSGTTLRVAEAHGRDAIGLDLYADPSDPVAKPEHLTLDAIADHGLGTGAYYFAVRVHAQAATLDEARATLYTHGLTLTDRQEAFVRGGGR